MTDKDIMNALECCKSDFVKCNDCYYCECPNACFAELAEDALLLIKRQQEEIERLKIENQSLRGAANSYKIHYEGLKSEIKELTKAYRES